MFETITPTFEHGRSTRAHIEDRQYVLTTGGRIIECRNPDGSFRFSIELSNPAMARVLMADLLAHRDAGVPA